jgi:hypothetical protein
MSFQDDVKRALDELPKTRMVVLLADLEIFPIRKLRRLWIVRRHSDEPVVSWPTLTAEESRRFRETIGLY